MDGAFFTPALDAMFTIAPCPAACMTRSSARMQRKVPRRSTLITLSQVSTGSSCRKPGWSAMPALLTAKSSPPRNDTDCSMSDSTLASDEMSQATNSAAPPAARISSTTPFPASASISDTTTRTPSPARYSAVARPIPAAAPVTTTPLPASVPNVANAIVVSPRISLVERSRRSAARSDRHPGNPLPDRLVHDGLHRQVPRRDRRDPGPHLVRANPGRLDVGLGQLPEAAGRLGDPPQERLVPAGVDLVHGRRAPRLVHGEPLGLRQPGGRRDQRRRRVREPA